MKAVDGGVVFALLLAGLGWSCSGSGDSGPGAVDAVRDASGVIEFDCGGRDVDGTDVGDDFVGLDLGKDRVEGDGRAPDAEVAGTLDVAEPTGPFRIGVITDIHFTAVETHAKNIAFAQAGDLFSTMTPKVDLVVATGDNIEDFLVFPFELPNLTEIPVIRLYHDAINERYLMPYYIVPGNHDDRFFDTFMPEIDTWKYWLETFSDTESFPARHYYFDHRGFRFIVVDCTVGAFDHESNDTCLPGDEQVQWLDSLLAAPKPALLFMHMELRPDESGLESHPLFPVWETHQENLKAVFMGHTHTFHKTDWNGIQLLTTGVLENQGKQAYHLIECDPDTASISIINESEIVYE